MTHGLPFIPIFIVTINHGTSPFLGLVDALDEDGMGCKRCDSSVLNESFPMSEGLWQKFADWTIEFDRTALYSDNSNNNGWDWLAVHIRGLELARRFKEAVGETYRVSYLKSNEDPNHRIDERLEILTSGALMPLSPFRGSLPEPGRFCQHIISGGQTGADRGALDFAIKHGYTHGGFAPRGRLAEDGLIPLKYQLNELKKGGYRQRNKRNVEGSDGTLIVNLGELDGGTMATQVFAQRSSKPHLVVQLDHGVTAEVVVSVIEWVQQHDIQTLNVAGPRESKRPGIYNLTRELLVKVDASNLS